MIKKSLECNPKLIKSVYGKAKLMASMHLIKLFKKHPNKSIVSFSPLDKKNNKVVKTSSIANEVKLNGSIYLVSSNNIRKHKSFFKPHVLPLVQNNLEESIDIDTLDDWKFAERLKK